MILLQEILRYQRGHLSLTEQTFIEQYLVPTITAMGLDATFDAVGNIIVETAPPEAAPYLFTCHIDTCHRGEGVVLLADNQGMLSICPTNAPGVNCLGADDAVGIYCNLSMMQAGVAGTFLFTRGEECGGVGAGYLRDECGEFLEQFDMCIEVDRAGKEEIITHQAGSKCASDDFSYDLAEQLGMGHLPSDEGIYTDCAEFIDFIPECVNIAAGYWSQHTPSECVDTVYVEALLKKLIEVDWSALTVSRDVTDQACNWGNYYIGGDIDNPYLNDTPTDKSYETAVMLSYNQTLSMVRDNSAMVAWFLYESGVDWQEIKELWSRDLPDLDSSYEQTTPTKH